MKIKLALLVLGVTLISGCTVKEETGKNTQQEVQQKVKFDENQYPYDKYGEIIKTNEEVYKLYETVDKDSLKYSHDNNVESYDYEYDSGVPTMSSIQTVEGINHKKYKNILQAFSFASEINPVNITYDKAMELVKKVLPDDIKLESKNDYIGTDDVGTSVIHFNSSKGNFIVNFLYGYGEDGINYDTDNIAGIVYLKQVDM